MSSIGPVTVSAIGGHEMHLRAMSGNEELGRLFEYSLELLSPDVNIKLTDVLGTAVTVTVHLRDGGFRYFNGYISRFAYAGVSGDSAIYRATVHPWLWFLTRTADCRIFNGQSVPDIIKRIFGYYTEAQFEGALPGFEPRDYVVQYRETDFNFISRLMEEEGIYYYFRHEETQHKLIFADAVGAHDTYALATVPFLASTNSGRHAIDHFDMWRVSQEVQPAGYSMKDYDFKEPRGDRLSSVQLKKDDDKRTARGAFFDYPGNYPSRAAGDLLSRIRIDEISTQYELVETQGTTRALGVGQTFRMTDLTRVDQNREYLVVRAHYEIRTHDTDSGHDEEEEIFRASYTLLDSTQQFRPTRQTPRPIVQGPQTAIVVGDKKTVDDKSEICTDKFGRVHLRFYWERLGPERPGKKDDADTKNEDLTCWVRVSQLWAGSQWGGIHIPRIGQEVVVDFLEGDPDKPLVTGRVYNNDNMPPYELPANKTQSGIKSRSAIGAGPSNFNEIRFEDKKGAEELHLQAERDQTTLVKRNQSITVNGDRSVSVGGNETISVSGTRTSTITKKETQTFNDAREMKVAKTDDIEITGAHTGKYHAGRTETVEKGDTLTVMDSDKTVTVHGVYNTVADKQFQVDQGSQKILLKDAVTITNGSCTISFQKGVAKLDAADEITLTCGQSSLSLKKDGTIEIHGAQKVTTSGASAGTELSAAGATMSGMKVSVSGSTMTEITGAIVKIN